MLQNCCLDHFSHLFTSSLTIPSDSPTSFNVSHEQKYQFPTFKRPLLISNIFGHRLFCFSFMLSLTFAELFHFPPPQSLFASLYCGGYQNSTNWYPESVLGSMMLHYFLVFPSSKCLQNEILWAKIIFKFWTFQHALQGVFNTELDILGFIMIWISKE